MYFYSRSIIAEMTDLSREIPRKEMAVEKAREESEPAAFKPKAAAPGGFALCEQRLDMFAKCEFNGRERNAPHQPEDAARSS
jgi:hypothetical protein